MVRAGPFPVVTQLTPPGSSSPLQVHGHIPAWHWESITVLCREKLAGGVSHSPGRAASSGWEARACQVQPWRWHLAAWGAQPWGAERVGLVAPRCLPSIRASGREVPSNTHSTVMSTHLSCPEEDLSSLAMAAGSLSQVCRHSPEPPV